MINVMLADDTAVKRDLITEILNSDPKIKVARTAKNGKEAVRMAGEERFDVIIMDINMPEMDGFEAAKIIMQANPVPIIMISATEDIKDEKIVMRAMEAGALAVISSPKYTAVDYERTAQELKQTTKLMAEVKVIRRRPLVSKAGLTPPSVAARQPGDIQVLAIGASTGGPIVIQTILSGLPKNFPAPILIVQHIAQGFMESFIDWLSQTSSLPVHVAVHGEHVFPGHVYVAPDDFHMGVSPAKRIILAKDAPENGLRPAVSFLFRSVAENFGKSSAAVLLTGMGADGARELKVLRDAGAATIAQDKESSVVFGMPGESVKLDAAQYVLPPQEIIATLKKLYGV